MRGRQLDFCRDKNKDINTETGLQPLQSSWRNSAAADYLKPEALTCSLHPGLLCSQTPLLDSAHPPVGVQSPSAPPAPLPCCCLEEREAFIITETDAGCKHFSGCSDTHPQTHSPYVAGRHQRSFQGPNQHQAAQDKFQTVRGSQKHRGQDHSQDLPHSALN